MKRIALAVMNRKGISLKERFKIVFGLLNVFFFILLTQGHERNKLAQAIRAIVSKVLLKN